MTTIDYEGLASGLESRSDLLSHSAAQAIRALVAERDEARKLLIDARLSISHHGLPNAVVNRLDAFLKEQPGSLTLR